MNDDDEERRAAELYRQEKQQAAAKKNDFASLTPNELYNWMDTNPELVRRVVNDIGVPNEDVTAFVEQYRASLENTGGSSLDDLNARMILTRAIEEIEQVCKMLNRVLLDCA